MTHHLSPSELVDAVDGVLEARRQKHAGECQACGEAVASLGESMQMLAQDEMPEPSPLFWDHFQRRVQEAVALEVPPASPVFAPSPWWHRWQSYAVGVAGIAAVVLAIVWSGGVREKAAGAEVAEVVAESLPVAAVDAEWEFVTNVLGTLEPDDMQQVLSPSPHAVDAAFAGLTEEERENFFRLLRAEMTAGME